MKNKRKIIYILMILIGIIGIIDFIFMILINAIMNLGAIAPALFGIPLILWGAWCLKNKKSLLGSIKHTFFGKVIIIGLIFFIVSFAIVESLIWIHAKPQTNIEKEYVVVLGAGLLGDQITYTLSSRLDIAYDYLIQYPNSKVILTGGQGPDELMTESEAMKQYLLSKGIEEIRIQKEEKSTSTMENLQYTKDIISISDSTEPIEIMLITSNFHMMRAKLLAKRNGFKAYSLPARTNPYIIVNCCIREYFAVFKSLIFDY